MWLESVPMKAGVADPGASRYVMDAVTRRLAGTPIGTEITPPSPPGSAGWGSQGPGLAVRHLDMTTSQ